MSSGDRRWLRREGTRWGRGWQVRWVLGRMRPLGCCRWGLVVPRASWQEEMPLGRRDGEKRRAARGSCPMVWGCSEVWVWDLGGVPLL